MKNLDLVELVKSKETEIINMRRELHKIPELQLLLPKTVEFVCKKLDSLQIPYYKLVDGNAIVAQIDGTKKGDSKKCIALRADMDGLPIVEDTDLEFKSTNGNMHACGHDGHIAMCLGAAKYLNSRKDEIKGTVKLLLQPGEEGGGGADIMVKEGALKNPDVDAVFGLHEGNLAIDGKIGQVLFKKGAMMASADSFIITINGKGSHAAYPSKGIDPVTVAAELILEIQRMKAREIASNETAVISVTTINAGDGAHNIIPEQVEILGTIRTMSPKTRDYVIERLGEICEGLSTATRTKIKAEYVQSYPVTVNDEEFTEFAYNVAKEIYGDKIGYMKDSVMAAEDMSFFLNEVQGAYAFLHNPRPIDGVIYPHHHPKFDVDEDCFETGAMTLASVALAYLNK